MRIIARRTLREFWQQHSDAEQALRAWFSETRRANWRAPVEVKRRYPTASLIGRERIVFNIKGNRYRLVVAVRYDAGIVFIRFVGTHDEYNRIDATEV